jgi:hypothetical protein
VQGLSAVQHSQFCSPGWQLDVVFLVVVVGFAFVVAIGFAFVIGSGAVVVVVQVQVLVRPHDSSVG